MTIIFEIPIIIIIICLLGLIGLGQMIINTLIQDILYLIIAITTIMSFISIVAFVGNYRKERKNVFLSFKHCFISCIFSVYFFDNRNSRFGSK